MKRLSNSLARKRTGVLASISARASFVILGLVYSSIIYLSYPVFHRWVAFHAFRLKDHDPEHAIAAFSFTVAALIVASFVKHPVYRLFNSAFLFSVYIPALILLPYFDSGFLVDGTAVLLLASSMIVSLMGWLVSEKIIIRSGAVLRERDFLILLGAASLFTSLLIVFVFRDIFSISSLTDVYAQRQRYRERSNIFSYLIHWEMMVLSPLCLFFGARRSISLTAIGLFGSISVYGITAFKLAPAISILVLLSSQWRPLSEMPRRILFVPIVFVAAFSSSFALDEFVFDLPVLSFYIIDRNIIGPGIMQLMTVEAFSEMPKAVWSNSFMSLFFEKVYDKDPFIILGMTFFGSEVRANSGYFADGFINLGPLGVVIMSIAAGICLAITSALMNKLPKRFIVATLPFVLGYINGPLQVTILTNGLLLFWAIIFLYPSRSLKVAGP